MARTARIKDDFGTFLIRQTGGGERVLFENEGDRYRFMEILKRTQSNFNFKLYAYCLLSDNEYQLVLDTNGSDLSKVMKSINIGYAMYVKCKGRLFKDRYRSTLMNDRDETLKTIGALHDRSKEATEWNSFCVYSGKSPLKLDWVSPLKKEDTEPADALQSDKECRDCLHTLEEAKAKLSSIAQDSGQTLDELLNDRELRNQMIHDFRKRTTLSLKEIGVLFGGISESTVCKIIKST